MERKRLSELLGLLLLLDLLHLVVTGRSALGENFGRVQILDLRQTINPESTSGHPESGLDSEDYPESG